MTDELVNRLSEQRARTWEEAKSLLDHAASENRDLSAEEAEQFTRMNDDIDALDARRKNIIDVEARERAIDESRAALGVPADFGMRAVAPAEKSDSDIIRELANGERRSFSFDTRDVTKSSTGAPVATSFYDRLVEQLVVQGPMLDGNVVTILTTNSGENLQIPRTATYTAPAITAEGTAIGESDPTFASFVTLGAFKYAATFQLSREVVEDSGLGDLNLLDFVARQAAVGMGTAVNAGLTVGTGTTQPNGIVNGAGSAVTGGTGVAGVPSYEALVDLVYSVASPYRRRGASFQMNASTVAAVRKIQDGNGAYIWQPSFQDGQPDQLLGFPVLENPDIAAAGTGVKSVIFGDMASAYYVRQVRGIDFARDDSVGFVNDLITFRVTWRGDGAVVDANAVKFFKGGAS
jgi:HK97 family phage major capsid protein